MAWNIRTWSLNHYTVNVDTILESLGLAGNKAFLPLILDAMARWGGEQPFMIRQPQR